MVSVAALPAAAHDGDRHAKPRVEISRVQADGRGRDNRSNRSLNAEWVEIANTTRHAVNLDGWILTPTDHGDSESEPSATQAGRQTVCDIEIGPVERQLVRGARVPRRRGRRRGRPPYR